MFNWYRISMCFTWFLCQFVFNKRFLKIYCLFVHSFFLVSFTSMYTTLKIISRKFLGANLIWTFFFTCWSHFLWNSSNKERSLVNFHLFCNNLACLVLSMYFYNNFVTITFYLINTLNFRGLLCVCNCWDCHVMHGFCVT